MRGQVYSEAERNIMLEKMQAAAARFYKDAVCIGNHPFIEFTGLINEYIKACRDAHMAGMDFTQCNKHTGMPLPLKPFMVAYINEKLECIFTGQSVMRNHLLSDGVVAPTDMKWNWHSGTDRSYLFLGKLYVGMVRQYPGLKSYKASWGAWLMTDDQGESVGWHATESEARAALEQAAKRAVGGE